MPRRTRVLTLLASGVLMLLVANGCAQVLGIDEAHGLAPSGGAASGGSGTMLASGSMTQSVTGGQSAGTSNVQATPGGSPDSEPADAGAGGEGGSPDAPRASLCERYCDAITLSCAGEHAQYIDRDGCLAACADLPPGQEGDKTGNSVSCRLTYADKASSEPYTYCTWAGPGGDGKCGSNCDGFCSLMMRACTATTTEPGDYFSSAADCQARCAQLKDVGSYSASDTSLQVGADHVQCRLYHVGAALAEDDPITHCQHAMGLKLCVDAAMP